MDGATAYFFVADISNESPNYGPNVRMRKVTRHMFTSVQLMTAITD